MSISKEQQNILDNLRLPIKSFRIFALEEVIKSGGNSEILSVLEEIRATEDDPECSMLISHAINAVKSSLSSSKKAEPVVLGDTKEFLANWKEADENLRMHIISNLPARLPKDIRTLGPELVEGSSPIVIARVIRAFGRNWPEDKFNIITSNLNSESLVLKLAALRTMVHLKPELLLDNLPELLASADPEIKALAIRALVKIDKEEALNHLQALLLSPTKTERLAGIQNCPFLPFETVKPLLLKYFAAETNPELLTKAGWIIEMNPDVEVPFTLFEIAERSPAKKADLVKKVLNEAVRLLNKSGILGDKFAAYTRKLQNWVNKRNALRFARQVVSKLDSETVSPDIEQKIAVAIKQPIGKEAFIEALKWPLSDLAKSRLAKYLGIQYPESVQTPKEEQKQEREPVTLAEKKQSLSQFEMLATITPEKAAEKIDYFILAINNKDSSSELKIAILQCLTRCKLAGVEDIAVRLIKSHDVAVATAAVEYLGIVNPDCIFPYLGQCLKISDVGMKSAALGILKNFDYNQAVSSLRAMMYSTDNNQQKMAMECIGQFDFALIRDMLTEFLCLDYHEGLLEAGLCHFAANPSADNVYSLYKIEQAHPGKIAEQARSLREACPEPTEEIAGTLSEEKDGAESSESDKTKEEVKSDKDAKEAELKERLRLEKEKRASKRPAYAYRSNVELPERTSKQQLIAIWNGITAFVQSKALPISIITFLIVAPLVYYLFFYTPGSENKKAKGGAVVCEPLVIEGKVDAVDDGVVTIKATNDETYILVPLKDGWKVPEVQRLIRALIVPYRKSSNGEIAAHLGEEGYIYIDAYTEEFSGDKAK
ncbi:MAG: HEAT repeat domain-containing protein [Candidatus Riflebacteria bacterium]|nr:HEAT repeat domain-containing protein [Candidatus Riflebacteria bacterium]